MTHVYHEALPGYSADDVLHDGCPECDARAADPRIGLSHLDDRNRIRMWAKMRAYHFQGGGVDPVSQNDLQVMGLMYTIAVFLERAALSAGDIEDRLVAEHERLLDTLEGCA